MHPSFDDRPARDRFLRKNVEAVYHTVTDGMTRFVRVEDLVRDAAEAYPGLLPTRKQLAAESGRPLKDKEGWEVDQSLLLAHVLADPRCGTHLCHAMLLPRPRRRRHWRLCRLRDLWILDPCASNGTAAHYIC
jgi:thioesterase DpgC